MPSRTRIDSNTFVQRCFSIIDTNSPKNILYCGVAGNPVGKIGKYSGPIPDLENLYANHILETFDVDPVWGPSIVADITDINSFDKKYLQYFDIIVVTQVIEHVQNLHTIHITINRLLKIGGFAIIDCPWGPQSPDYHGEPPSFGDYWRISDDGLMLIFCRTPGFSLLHKERTSANAGILIQKKSEI